MYNNYVLFVIGFFLFTIIIQCLDREVGKKENFKGFFKKAGRGIKKFAQSPAGIATFSILAGAACGVATAGVASAACAGAVAGGIGGSIHEDNKKRKKRYNQRKKKEYRRRCRVLTGREAPFQNGKNPFNGYESIFNPCKEFRDNKCYSSTNDLCSTLKTQCRLARSCVYHDSHLIDKEKSRKIDRARN